MADPGNGGPREWRTGTEVSMGQNVRGAKSPDTVVWEAQGNR